jgi:hypothetical protein
VLDECYRPVTAICDGRLLPRKLFFVIRQISGFLIGGNFNLEERASSRVHSFGRFAPYKWLPRWFDEFS